MEVFVIVVLPIYFLPAIIAFWRHHHQVVPILLLNLFLGWTFVGWVVALVWSALHISESVRLEQEEKTMHKGSREILIATVVSIAVYLGLLSLATVWQVVSLVFRD